MTSPSRLPVLVVFGTRPEAIKLAPVILALQTSKYLTPVICVTAQHRELMDQVLQVFELSSHHDLNIMTERQSLEDITTKAISGLAAVVKTVLPSCIVVQGDTTTAFAAALSGFYRGIKVGHVEAGLRTFDKADPFPEEINRRLISQLADFHFAPTPSARKNLFAEGIPEERVLVTGNTIVDAFLAMEKRLPARPAAGKKGISVLVTTHRRENWGAPMRRICQGLKLLIAADPELEIVFPVHPNPQVREVVEKELQGVPRIELLPPQGYVDFLALLRAATVVLTDSGGVQEEVASMGKPVVILRELTERPEVVEAGFGTIAGTDPDKIASVALRLARQWKAPAGGSPFGDGLASSRIVTFLEKNLAAV